MKINFRKLRSHFRSIATSVGTFLLFFAIWALVISIPLALWNEPSFTANNAAMLRFYWEIVPLIGIVAVTGLFVVHDRRKHRSVQFQWSKHWTKDTFGGVVGGAIWLGLVLAALYALGVFKPATPAMMATDTFILFSVALFLNTIMQEMLVRGYLFSYFSTKHGKIAALVVTTILFTLMHAGVFSAGLLAILNIAAAGTLLGLSLIYSRGLWMPILIHFIWNYGEMLFGPNTVTGSSGFGDYPQMSHSTLVGNTLLTGAHGTGIEGNIVTLTISLLLCAALSWYIWKHKKLATNR